MGNSTESENVERKENMEQKIYNNNDIKSSKLKKKKEKK